MIDLIIAVGLVLLTLGIIFTTVRNALAPDPSVRYRIMHNHSTEKFELSEWVHSFPFGRWVVRGEYDKEIQAKVEMKRTADAVISIKYYDRNGSEDHSF